MKKRLVVFTGMLLLLVIAVFVLIPRNIVIKTSTSIKVPGTAIHRMLLEKDNLSEWWPGQFASGNFSVNDVTYKIGAGNITVMPVTISVKKLSLTTSLFLTSVTTDSTHVQWIGSIAASYNPIRRVLQYFQAKKINQDMTLILNKMQSFFSRQINIYGFEVQKIILTDTLFIATSAISDGYPTTGFIYSMIDKLKNFAASHAAKENGIPMLNIFTSDNSHYDVKVALPIDKALPPTGDILQKRMPASGKLLMIEAKGGIAANTRALYQLQLYADDYHRKSPAISYYSLITDRTKEQDSSKWITKIYLPVM